MNALSKMFGDIDSVSAGAERFHFDGTDVYFQAKITEGDADKIVGIRSFQSVAEEHEQLSRVINQKLNSDQLNFLTKKFSSISKYLIDFKTMMRFNVSSKSRKVGSVEIKDAFHSQDYVRDQQFPFFKSAVYLADKDDPIILDIPVQAVNHLIRSMVKGDQFMAAQQGICAEDIVSVHMLDLTNDGKADMEADFVNRRGFFSLYDVQKQILAIR